MWGGCARGCRFFGLRRLGEKADFRWGASPAEAERTSRTCNGRSGEPQSLQKTCSTGKIEIIPGLVAATNSRNPLEKFSGSNVRYTSSIVFISAGVPMALNFAVLWMPQRFRFLYSRVAQSRFPEPGGRPESAPKAMNRSGHPTLAAR